MNDDVFLNTIKELRRYGPAGMGYVKTPSEMKEEEYWFSEPNNEMEENSMSFNFIQGTFGPIGSGMCRLTVDGQIAVKTASGYKSYDMEKNSFYNCDNFVFDVGDDMFFVIPTNQVAPGDIVLINKKPKFVKSVDSDMLTIIDFEDGSVKQLIPERHVFLGNTYLYGKIVSLFGDITKVSGAENVLKYMMMSQMFRGGSMGDSNPMMMLMLMNGMGNDIFSGLFGNKSDKKEV